MSPRKPIATAGIKQLLSDDPCQTLLHSVEAVQAQAHYRRVGRVLRHHRRRRDTAGWVHASELVNPCDCAIGAMLLGYRPPQRIDARLQRIFDNGNMMHLRWQNYFLSLPPRFQITVGQSFYRWPVAGEPDIVLEHPDFGRVVVELKSINHARFQALRSPMPDHAAQVAAYVMLTDASSAQVWYESKDTQEVKLFGDNNLVAAHEEVLSRVGRAREIADVVLAGRMPKSCGKCEWDAWAGDLKIDEGRISMLAEAKRSG